MNTTDTDHGFKLLAIRPLEGCDRKFLKNLKAGMLYKFYQDYTYYVEDDEGNEVELTNLNFDQFKNKPISKIDAPKQEVDLYSQDDLKINISAVVGMNGSGKSSIFDIHNAVIYIISEQLKLFDEIGLHHSEKLVNEMRDARIGDIGMQNYYKKFLETLKSIQEDNEISNEDKYNNILKIATTEVPAKDVISKEESLIKSYNETIKAIKCEVFFTFGAGSVFVLSSLKPESGDDNYFRKWFFLREKNQKSNFWCELSSADESQILNFLYYSVVINYSIHGLNTIHQGQWLNPLFHKNDGYLTPIVINPMRDDGWYDINEENNLAKNRLISNITSIKNHTISEFQYARYLKLTLKTNSEFVNQNKPSAFASLWKSDLLNNEKIDLNAFILKKIGVDNENKIGIAFENETKIYIVRKVLRILERYEPYKTDFKERNSNSLGEYIQKLLDDFSHVTFKLRQAINYLNGSFILEVINESKLDSFYLDNQTLIEFGRIYDNKTFYLDIAKMSKCLSSLTYKKRELPIHYLPPPIFETDILISKGKNSNSELSTFSSLSSGEQQHIHSIHSILYHLNNLNSVFKKPEESKRQTYPNINILLDEIELYFHPNYQRKFIADLLSGIKRLNIGGKTNEGKPNGIQSLNILFATHSPFILSDIPSQNVLRLKDGKPYEESQKGTFGANVHDLLHDSFFMEDGFMGKFATEKINQVIQSLTSRILINREQTLRDKTMNKKQELSFLKQQHGFSELKTLDFMDQDECEKAIMLIGEPALSISLTELFAEAFPGRQKDKLVEFQIERLKNL